MLGPYVLMDRSRIVLKRFQIETYKHIVEKYQKEELIGSHIGGKLNMHITHPFTVLFYHIYAV